MLGQGTLSGSAISDVALSPVTPKATGTSRGMARTAAAASSALAVKSAASAKSRPYLLPSAIVAVLARAATAARAFVSPIAAIRASARSAARTYDLATLSTKLSSHSLALASAHVVRDAIRLFQRARLLGRKSKPGFDGEMNG